MSLEALINPEISRFKSITPITRSNPTFIPIHLTGGVGDIIISIDALRELNKTYQMVIYTHHLEAFRYFYRDPIPTFKGLPNFTWCLEFNTVAKFSCTDSFSGFLVNSHQDLFNKQLMAFTEEPRLESLVKTHINKFFLISNHGAEHGITRREFPIYSLGLPTEMPFAFLDRAKAKKQITIHDGYDIHNKSLVSGRATKQWKWEHWNKLVKLLKHKYKGYKIIQLGAITARAIDGVDECLIDQTTIVEAFDILSHSALHIDGDSGLVHAATRMQVPCVVLWGPTPPKFYAYEQNVNLTSNVCKQACYGVKQNWNDRCVLDYSSPKCMDEITPEQVIEGIKL